MTTVEGSNATSRRKRTEKGTRRPWTDKEEAALLALLKDAITLGWKTENGMRPGYMKQLEIGLKRVFPGTDLRVDPHISSRITAWKRNYASLMTILTTSGVGFNLNGDFKVECDDEQWEYFIRLDANASKIRKGNWPLYEGWKEVFGKDRATGDVVEDVLDAVDMLNSVNIETSMDSPVDTSGKNKGPLREGEDTSVCQSSRQDTTTSHSKKKKKTDKGKESMCALLEQIHRDTNATIQTIASRFSQSAEISKAGKADSRSLF